MQEKKKLIVLTGPTGVGKTKLSIALAHALDAEIISADSMQVYRGMDIGTDKIKRKDMDGIPHYLVDVLSPTEPFNVFLFQSMAKNALQEIEAHGRIPMLVGGTGFYIQAVLYDIDFDKEDDDAYRKELELFAENGGEDAVKELHERLRSIDPDAAAQIHPNNVKRVIRALSFYRETGKKISVHNEAERKKESPYDFHYFVLTDDRAVLYERINARVDAMMENGLVEEVRRLIAEGVREDMTSMQGLGYREMLAYFNGAYPLEKAVELIKRNTRHFAKRQLTWYTRERNVTMIDKRDYDRDDKKILEAMLRMIHEA
ncbi:MAG: tRNA (adenosine(37)-N6)-dimethylallyltransferase MiaA [Lachnospiraceae bacterium]|nr:tRNA (adenosine(37)-N6)-dimethylallyltransferase MiaA [Lachnospiraceae bacterium]